MQTGLLQPYRLASQAVVGVKHESPQAILFHNGEVVWHASHGAITVESLTRAIQEQCGKPA